MKKLLVVLLVIVVFCLTGCIDDSYKFGTAYFCRECHGASCKQEGAEYWNDNDCIKCHELEVCERGNSWKKRELSKRKSLPKKKKRRR